MKQRVLPIVTIAILVANCVWAVDWPQEIEAPEGTIVVYQPQPEDMTGNTLTGRAAMSLELKDQDAVFGAMWFSARIDTDKDNGTAIVRDVKITRVGWPESKDAGEQRFTAIVEAAIANSTFEISMERLSSSLASSQREKKSLEELKHEPPKILFRDHLAVLLVYDGQPRFKAVDDSDYERAMNVPMAVARHRSSKTCYLSSGVFWYQAGDPLGPWSITTSPPPDLVELLPQADESIAHPKTAPAIVAATEPTELICSDGKPDWQTLSGGGILYVQNTETPWLRELSTGSMYVLLSGRWFRSKTQEGPWTFVRADELPPSFKDIPPDSDIGGVRTSVAGTSEAEEAMLEASIPQTSTIDRSEASLTVEYDGAPKFEKVTGTDVSYAVNTGAQVLEIANLYYAVDNGVWFASASPTGPWVVADSVPREQIDAIPPSSPVYNTTYVYIYEATPTYVTVGYMPGYMWSFPYYGVPVYGTGYYYPPYWGVYYYPRPPTWGVHVGYNPWTGWTYGVSWSNGFVSVGVSWGAGYGRYGPGGCCCGHYGGGYRRPVVINTGDINIGNTINVGNRNNIGNKMRDNPEFANRRDGNQNLYNRPENKKRQASPATTQRDRKKAKPAPSRKNDVFADKNGNVSRKTDRGWEDRSGGSWKQNEKPQQRQELDRAQRSRQSGAQRERARPQRSGGGRRR